ncbi:FAD-binding oxidoreductase [candidate division KSB1 bacterium]
MTANKTDALKENILKKTGSEDIILSEGLEFYAIDGVVPDLACYPHNTAELQKIIQASDQEKFPVIPFGGFTRVNTFEYSERSFAAVDLKRMNRVIFYDPAEFVIIPEAGITISELNKVLAENGQFCGFNPPETEKATLGGVLASNSYGYFREFYGLPRDNVLGMKFVKADGTLIKSGGKVAKNVAGYNLQRLMTGSWGTLGIITEAAIRVYSLPDIQKTFTAEFLSPNDAANTIILLQDSCNSPVFTAVLSNIKTSVDQNSDKIKVIFGADGIKENVDKMVDRFHKVCKENNVIDTKLDSEDGSVSLRNNISEFNSSQYSGIIIKILSTRMGILNLFEVINNSQNDFILKPEVLAYPGSGVMYIRISGSNDYPESGELKNTVLQIKSLLDNDNCFCVLEKIPKELKKEMHVWPQFNGYSLMQKIKTKFDPNNILNPERYIHTHS